MSDTKGQIVKDWHNGMIGMRVVSDSDQEVVHIVVREKVARYLKQLSKPSTSSKRRYVWRGGNAEAVCGRVLNLDLLGAYSEAGEADINCETCIAKYEKDQARITEFLESGALEALVAFWKQRAELRELAHQVEDLHQRVKAHDDLMDSCFAIKEPLTILELPDAMVSRLSTFSGLGEVLFAYKLQPKTRQILVDRLGIGGFWLLESALRIKGYLDNSEYVFDDSGVKA